MKFFKVLISLTILFLIFSLYLSNQTSVGYLISIAIYLAVILAPLILTFSLIKRNANPRTYYFSSIIISLSFILIWILMFLFPIFSFFGFKVLCSWPPSPKGVMLCDIYNFIDIYISFILFIFPAWLLILKAEKLRTKKGTSILAVLAIIIGIITAILATVFFVL